VLSVCRFRDGAWRDDYVSSYKRSLVDSELGVRFDQSQNPEVLRYNDRELQRWRWGFDRWLVTRLSYDPYGFEGPFFSVNQGRRTHVVYQNQNRLAYYLEVTDDAQVTRKIALPLAEHRLIMDLTTDEAGNVYVVFRPTGTTALSAVTVARIGLDSQVKTSTIAWIWPSGAELLSLSVGPAGELYLAASSNKRTDGQALLRTLTPR
jgi:hypothetical protein